MLRHVWRYIRPYASAAGKAIGEEGAGAAQRVIRNLAQGADLKETLRKEGKRGVGRLLQRASADVVHDQDGQGLHVGEVHRRPRRPAQPIRGRKPKPKKPKGLRPPRNRIILAPSDISQQSMHLDALRDQKSKKKGPRKDAFGFY